MFKKIILVVIILIMLSSIGSAQAIQSLTDRELLIQLMERVTSIVNTVNRTENKTDVITDKVSTLENKIVDLQGQIDGLIRRDIVNTDKVESIEVRAIQNEKCIAVFMDKVDILVDRWNVLLGLFATLLLGMFVYMWKEISKGKLRV